MSLYPIPNPSGWLGILTKLGLTQSPRFTLNDVVQPVALVDSEITLNAITVPTLYGTPASGGETAAPGAGTRLADTGQLTAGAWVCTVFFSSNDNGAAPNNLAWRLRRRNAADAADIWSFRFAQGTANVAWSPITLRLTFAQSERLVVETVGAATAATTYQASIFAVQL